MSQEAPMIPGSLDVMPEAPPLQMPGTPAATPAPPPAAVPPPNPDDPPPGLSPLERDRWSMEKAALAEREKLKAMSPAERWLYFLGKAKVSEQQANVILDHMFEKGYYEETYGLFRDRLKITFRTRPAYASQRMSDEWDRSQTGDPKVLGQIQARYMLAFALHAYNGVALPAFTDDMTLDAREKVLQDRIKFLDFRIQGHVIEAVVNKMNAFDTMVSAALSEEAASGF